VDPSSKQPAPAAETGTARAAGRGGLAIAGAKAAFILFGFVQQIILPKLVGDAGYGQISLVLALVSIVNNVIVATSIQGVSRSVSSAPAGKEDEAFRATLRVHVVVAMLASAGFAACAGMIAEREGAAHITNPLRLVALVILLYGIYAPLVGSLNGRRRFGTQAALDTGYGIMRMTGILAGAWLFLRSGASGVMGAFAGFVLAAAIIFPIALGRTGTGKSGDGGPTAGEYLRFLVPLALGQISLNVLMQTDFLLLRPFSGAVAPSHEAADTLQGYYRGVQLFSFLPYQLLMSVTFILFPMLARAHADGDKAAVRGYTTTGVRLALLLTVLMSGTVSGLAAHVLRFAYSQDYAASGGGALRIHAIGLGAFSVLGTTCAALTSLGRERVSAFLTAGAVGLVALGCVALVPRAAFGPEMLLASATAVAGAMTLAAAIGGTLLARTAGGFVAPLTLVRGLVTLGVLVAIGSRMPWLGKLFVPVEAAALFAVGIVVLLVSGELGKDDLAKVMAVAGRKKS
jgi:stage V sporulation protein B